MPVYAVRLKSTHEAVGIFYVARIGDLFWAVDECTDPFQCERIELPHGSLFWSRSPCRKWGPGASENDRSDPERDRPDEGAAWASVLDEATNWKPVPGPP